MKTRNLSILIALSCIGASAAANYDLLGRKGSQMNSPMVYKNVNYKAPKGSLEESVLAKQGLDSDVRGIAGIFEGYYYDMLKSYPFTFLIYKKNKTDMITSLTQYTTNFTPVYTSSKEATYINPAHNGITSYFSENTIPNKYCGKTSDCTKCDYHIDDPYAETYIKDIGIISSSYLRKKDLFNGYDLKANTSEEIGISIGVDEVPAGANHSYDKNINYRYAAIHENVCGTMTSPETPNAKLYQYDAFKTGLWLNALRTFTKNVSPYLYFPSCGESTPAYPELRYPQIYIGLHIKDESREGKKNYESAAKQLDNAIYNNHTIEIVGAGNSGENTGYLATEAHSINAITVGSANYGKDIEESSPYKNPNYGTNKPEIYNFTNYYSKNAISLMYYLNSNNSYFPFITGSAGAAINTAAAVADLLRAEPFFKWHPELVKARLLTASDIQAKNSSGKYDKILDYAKLFDAVRPSSESQGAGRYKHYSRFWNGESNVLLTSKVDGYSAVKFTEYVAKNHRYRAAIAWLTPGDDIANSKTTIPQDFDLELFWNNNLGANTLYSTDGTRTPFSYFTSHGTLNNSTSITNSTSGNNPYELVEFTADRDGYVTFVIKQFRDNEKCGSAKCKGYGKMQLGFDLIDIEGK